LAWSMVFLAPLRKEHLGSKQERTMSREGCEHTTYCLGCGRSGPVCNRSMEAVIALREIPQLAFQQKRR
jgi:hypothetical protein